jgi:aspartyl-tRNA(Asn)/glutamyl-tRNA(Gln) amidotransferase subunit C
MNSKDIKHLAHLSRLHITNEEVEQYAKQFDEIVGYVDKIKEVSIDQSTQQVRDKNTPNNILREDEVNSYTNPEIIINESPRHHDNFVQVKKILNQ